MKSRTRPQIWWLVFGVMVAVAPSLVPRSQPPGRIELSARVFRFPLDDVSGTLSDIPAELRGLDGKRVTVIGMMFVGDATQAPFRSGQMVPDRDYNAFVGPPLVQQRVFTKAVPGSQATRSMVPFDTTLSCIEATGTFHVRLDRNPRTGKIGSVFSLDADQFAPYGGTPVPREPGWVPAVYLIGIFTAVLTVLLLMRRTRSDNRRRASGLCVRCGYDLRYSTDRCPECGATIPRPPPVAGDRADPRQ